MHCLFRRLLHCYSYCQPLPLLRLNNKVKALTLKKEIKSQSKSLQFQFHQFRNIVASNKIKTIHKPEAYTNLNFKEMSTNVTECETAIITKEDANEFEAKSTADSSESSNKTMSKRALKRKARAEQFKEWKKKKKAESRVQTSREGAGYSMDVFDKTSYYFENGLRKVYPYHFVFSAYAKGRWVGRTLKHVLENEFGFDKPEDVDKAFHEGKIHVNDIQVSVDYVVKDCDFISHQIHRHENPVTDGPLEIIADTDEVVVINKPSSIPCHPCGRYRFNSVVFILGKEMGYTNLRNIYRLDRLTSGVLVIGKTADITKKLEDQVMNREVHKEYVCRVMGEFPSETVTVDQPLMALSNKLRLQVVNPKGKASQTTFTRLSYNGRSSVVKCVPRTGRTHQIRVHLQFLGHPIINDAFYNSSAWGPDKGKGGVYQVPNDVVCASIMKTHQATQWEGGENPLFFKKLEEMQQHQQQNRATEISHSQPLSTSDLGKSQEDNSSSNDSVIKMEETDKFTNDSIKEECHVNTDSTGSLLDENSSSEKSLSTQTQSRLGFDWSKWEVNESCDLCKMKILEPRPRDLVMFLHAWKYKGPDWAYQTELPDWAHPDWQSEHLYMLE